MSETPRLVEGEDFTFDADGRMVLTAAFLRRRGHCCGNGCRHCPYEPRHGGPQRARLPDAPARH